MRFRTGVLLLMLLIAVIGVSGCGFKKAKAAGMQGTAQSVAVTTEPMKITTMKNVITLNGKVKPVQEAEISPKVAGKVSQVFVDLGQRVNRGDILFKLDDKDLRLELKQAEASLNVTRTTLNSSLITAETNYQDAKRNFERTKRLYENHIVSKQEFESAESEFKLAEDTYNAAKTAEKNGVTKAQATLEQARAEYEIVKTNLENTIVRAAISGIVASKDLKIGKYVGTSDTVADLVDLSSVIVETNVTEAVVNQIRIGNKAEIYVKSTTDQALAGEIIAIAPAVDSSTLNYPVKIKVANRQNMLKSGMFAEVKLTLDRAEHVLAAPLASVLEESGRKYVYLFKNGKAAKKLIKIGINDGKLVEVTEGLAADETVIVKGKDLVKDGSKVIIGK